MSPSIARGSGSCFPIHVWRSRAPSRISKEQSGSNSCNAYSFLLPITSLRKGRRRRRVLLRTVSVGLPPAMNVTVVTCAPHHPQGSSLPGLSKSSSTDRETSRAFESYGSSPTSGRQRRVLGNASRTTLSYMITASSIRPFRAQAGYRDRHVPPVLLWLGGSARSAGSGARPLLLEIRDLWPESIVAVGAMRSRTALWFVEKLEQWMYWAARHIVTVGEGYRLGLIKRGVDPDRLSVVMNGVDRELFFPREKDREFANQLGVTDRFVITYCGTIGLAHGLEVVLRSATLLRQYDRSEIVFLMVGDGARLERIARCGGATRS